MNGLRRLLPALILAPVFASCATVPAPGPLGTDWSYHGKTGPAYWGTPGVCCAPCATGPEQSPVRIVTSQVKPALLHPLEFFYDTPADLAVVNDGHTIEAFVKSGGPRLEIGPDKFNLIRFHFHARSEHWIDLRDFPLEMHLVHQSSDGKQTAVVGIFIEEGAPNLELEKIWKNLPRKPGPRVPVAGFDLRKLLPSSLKSFRYPGSLTTPGCGEGLRWNVLNASIRMSPGQIAKFVSLFSGPNFPDGNRRPLQCLGDRVIETESR